MSGRHTSKTMAAICYKDVNDAVLQQLECSMCTQTCEPWIHGCSNGHVFCSDCDVSRYNCPLCVVKGNPLTSRPALDKLSLVVKRPCGNAEHGCTAMLNSADMVKHWESCKEAYSYDCWIDSNRCHCKCKHPQDLVRHVTTKHPGHYTEECVQLDVDMNDKSTHRNWRLVSAFEELFWMSCTYYGCLKHHWCTLSPYWIKQDGEKEGNTPRFECKYTYSSADGAIKHENTVPVWSLFQVRDSRLELNKAQLEPIFPDGKYSFVGKIKKRNNLSNANSESQIVG